MKTVSTDSASAAELETPNSMDEAMETGFLPDDEHYRLTGEFKQPADTEAAAASKKEKGKANQSEKTSASAAATEAEENQDESENAGASAASSRKTAASETAAAQKEEKERGQTRENRWQKRERELKELREKVARLEAKPQTEPQRSESQQTSTSQAAAAETKTAKAAPKPKIDDVDEKTGKAKYANYSAYEDAKDAWLQDEAVRKFQESSAKSAQVRERTEAEKKRAESFNKKFEAPRARYQDFDTVALNPDLLIPAGSVTDLFLDDSEHAGEVLYHLGQHPEILGEFHPARSQDEIKAGKYSNKISPQRQFRKLLEIEASVSGGSQSSGSQSSESRGESSSEKPSSAKPVTQASRPPHQVSGKGTVAKDAVEQALDDGDFETYQRTQNAKELARLRRK